MKTLLFISLTFGCSILTGLFLHFFGLSITSPVAGLILALFLMPSPAVATCIVHGFRWREIANAYGLDFRKLDYFYLGCSTLVFFISFFALYPALIWILGNLLGVPGIGHLTFSTETVWQQIMKSAGKIAATAPATPDIPLVPLLLIVAFPAAIVAGFSINGFFAFGEELGWRGFLWDRLRPYRLRGQLLLGLIWGFWHALIFILGYYFPHHPYLGIVFMVFLSISLTFPLTYLRDSSQTVYAPSAVHGMINACGIFGYIVVGNSELVGSVAGLVGCAAILLAWLMTVFIMRQWTPRSVAANA